MHEITEREVIMVLCSLTNSSLGWDNIPAKLLKPFIEEYIKLLTYIINKSFETGVFLGSFKLAKVILIYNRRAKLGQIQGGLQRAIQDSTKGGLQ